MIRPLFLTFTVILAGCAHPVYFPAGLSRDGACGPVISEHEAEWYSRLLYAANESSLVPLSEASGSEQVIRFIYLPSFEPQIIVRLTIPATGRIRLSAKKVHGDGRYEPYMVRSRVSKTLSEADSARVRAFIAKANLAQVASNGCEGPGLDGDTWIIESVEAGRYHYINRWVPPEGEVRAFGTELARLAGWGGDIRADFRTD